jgi:hypothetical protein
MPCLNCVELRKTGHMSIGVRYEIYIELLFNSSIALSIFGRHYWMLMFTTVSQHLAPSLRFVIEKPSVSNSTR